MIEKKILDIQCASTRAALLQSDEERALFHLKPIPKESQVRDEQGNIFLNERPITYEEAKVYQHMRYKAGERLAEIRKDTIGRPLIDEENLNTRKKSAIDAFMDKFSGVTLKEKFKNLMSSIFEPSHAEIMAEAMRKVKDDK